MKTLVDIKAEIDAEISAIVAEKDAAISNTSIVNINELVDIFELEIKEAIKQGNRSLDIQYFPYTVGDGKINFDIIRLDKTTRDALLADIRESGFTVNVTANNSFVEFNIDLTI